MDNGSTSGVNSRKMSITCAEIAVYRSKRGGTITAVGHRRMACETGIADRTP